MNTINHELKTWPEYFQAVWDGIKPFDLRKNDRDYKIGDLLLLKEWSPQTESYTGRHIGCTISYVLLGGVFGLPTDMCILGIRGHWRSES